MGKTALGKIKRGDQVVVIVRCRMCKKNKPSRKEKVASSYEFDNCNTLRIEMKGEKLKAIIKLRERPSRCYDCPAFRSLQDHGATVNLCNVELTRTDPFDMPSWCPIETIEEREE